MPAATDGSAPPPVRLTRVRTALQRIANGYYDRDDVRDRLAPAGRLERHVAHVARPLADAEAQRRQQRSSRRERQQGELVARVAGARWRGGYRHDDDNNNNNDAGDEKERVGGR